MQASSVMRRAALVLTVAVLSFGSCGTEDDPRAVAADQVPVAPGEIELDRADIAARKVAWRAARPAAYSYAIETTCDCALKGSFRVTVVGEERVVVDALSADAEAFRVYSPPTPDVAFAMLDEPLALVEGGEISDGRASASFDPTYGHPVSWTVRGSDGLPSAHAEIRDFVALDPASIDRPPPGLALVISNQSFSDPAVTLAVTVDGEVVVDRSFAVENQHTFVAYQLPLGPGDHQVTISADTGATNERVVTVGSDRRHLYVGYWGADANEAISVRESDQPFGFG